jgi:acetolactate synthase-1/2/3 large subunit
LGGKVIYNKLVENEVKDVFLYTGGAITSLIDALYSDERIKYYMNAHERNAGHAAIAYAKSTGRVGVSIITSDSGHGLINSITALTNTTNNNIPFVLFSGNVALSTIGTNAVGKCSATEITQPITKWSYCVKSVDELPDVVDEAFRFAQDGNPGAIHIDLPKCVTTDRFKNNGRRFRFDHKYTIDDNMKVES